MSSVVLAARRAPAGKGCRPCPAYLCQVGRMTADPSMPASGRLPRVGSAMLAGYNVVSRLQSTILRIDRHVSLLVEVRSTSDMHPTWRHRDVAALPPAATVKKVSSDLGLIPRSPDGCLGRNYYSFDSSQSASRSPDGLWVGLASHVLTETDRQTEGGR
ncbi:hypothetical protein BHM03_00014239 [Ensete ventricosum]|nr:hypothetical protein BHM03_00014239 [Ensete ventricosum]